MKKTKSKKTERVILTSDEFFKKWDKAIESAHLKAGTDRYFIGEDTESDIEVPLF